jgi:hypothetical protein
MKSFAYAIANFRSDKRMNVFRMKKNRKINNVQSQEDEPTPSGKLRKILHKVDIICSMITLVDANAHKKQYTLPPSTLVEHSLSMYSAALYLVENSCVWVQKNRQQ